MDDFQESEFEQTLNWNLNRKVRQKRDTAFIVLCWSLILVRLRFVQRSNNS